MVIQHIYCFSQITYFNGLCTANRWKAKLILDEAMKCDQSISVSQSMELKREKFKFYFDSSHICEAGAEQQHPSGMD